ncbi:MAG: hypothetical protein M3Y82_14855 [Verrucomicrobiota bacterium]|nr:hypothetical protein [Verrucomicrobiota bacterium]
MKLFLLLSVITTIFTSQAGTAPDRDIPIPKFTASEAIEKLAVHYKKFNQDPERFVVSVIYGRPDQMKDFLRGGVGLDKQEWSWFVTYTHPRKGESSVTYRLRSNGEIYPVIRAR